jgi:hypothetical protein
MTDDHHSHAYQQPPAAVRCSNCELIRGGGLPKCPLCGSESTDASNVESHKQVINDATTLRCILLGHDLVYSLLRDPPDPLLEWECIRCGKKTHQSYRPLERDS